MKTTLALLTVTIVAACATPGIEYSARLVPPNTAAVETRTVDVGRFNGPSGNWYASEFEEMLSTAMFDGRPWFSISRYSDGYVPDGQRAGIYEGGIDIEGYEAEEYSQTITECVEWDGLFDCERRAEVQQICLRETVQVSVNPRLVEYGTGRMIFQNTYFGEASAESCEETYLRGRRGRRGSSGGWRYGLNAGVQPPRDLVRNALVSTLGDIRHDIAPRNAVMRATFVDEAMDPVVVADPRFEQALKAARQSPGASCAVWHQLSVEYPHAPAVTHNLGACSESGGDYLAAHSLYAEAAEQASASGNMMDGQFGESLARLSAYRNGLQVLDRLTGARQPGPAY
jgi:hypothetical protein